VRAGRTPDSFAIRNSPVGENRAITAGFVGKGIVTSVVSRSTRNERGGGGVLMRTVHSVHNLGEIDDIWQKRYIGPVAARLT
jgi:hypothetical protein